MDVGAVGDCQGTAASAFRRITSANEQLMDPRAINKAESRLRGALSSLARLKRIDKFEDVSEEWFVFLTSWKSIYTSLEAGSRISPESKKWMLEQQRFKNEDRLLRYVYEARNDEEHGLESALDEQEGFTAIGVNRPGSSTSFTITTGLDGKMKFVSHDVRPVVVERLGRHARMRPVIDRQGRKVPVPDFHNAERIMDYDLIRVAEIATNHAMELIERAKTVPHSESQ